MRFPPAAGAAAPFVPPAWGLGTSVPSPAAAGNPAMIRLPLVTPAIDLEVEVDALRRGEDGIGPGLDVG